MKWRRIMPKFKKADVAAMAAEIEETYSLDADDAKNVAELLEKEDFTVDDLKDAKGGYGGWSHEGYGGWSHQGLKVDVAGREYLLFEDSDEAEEHALERVREYLENEPEIFSKDFISEYLTMSDTDIRLTAVDDADAYVYDGIDFDRVIEEFGDDMPERLTQWVDLYNDPDEITAEQAVKLELIADKEAFEAWKEEDYSDSDVTDAIENEFGSDMRDEASAKRADEVEAEIAKDPIGYFTDNYGYSLEDLMKNNLFSIDFDAAADAAIATDGVAHFLSSYDGNEIDLPSGGVAYRTN